MRWHIRGGRVIDPARGLDRVTDLYLAAGRVLSVDTPPPGFGDGQVRDDDARGLLVCPGFVDLCARLREPGSEHKATILSETRAAARAGITTLCCPPDTLPVIDTPAVAELVHRRAEESGHAKVVCLGALTAGLAGRQLAEMFHLKAIGCVGVSNAMSPIADTEVLRRAFEYAATAGLTVFLHAEDAWLGRGCLHEGPVATRLGLPGIPETAETVALSRDLLLIEQTGVRAHFCRLSSARAVALVRAAQDAGLPITADVAAHQLHLTDIDVGYYDSLCHVRPPLRSLRDREGLREGVRAGVIGAICSDHQPHERDAKTAPFEATEPGISALETLLPLTLALVGDAVLTLPEAIAALSLRPAQVLGIEAGSLAPGMPADVCLFDPQADRSLTEEALMSAGKNTPFLGWRPARQGDPHLRLGPAGVRRRGGDPVSPPSTRGTVCVEEALVLAHDPHPGEQWVLRLRAPEIAARARPGSFVHIQCDATLAMRRPMSIMHADVRAGTLDILYKVHGLGTRLLAGQVPGKPVSLLGPIGVPFRLDRLPPETAPHRRRRRDPAHGVPRPAPAARRKSDLALPPHGLRGAVPVPAPALADPGVRRAGAGHRRHAAHGGPWDREPAGEPSRLPGLLRRVCHRSGPPLARSPGHRQDARRSRCSPAVPRPC